MAPTAIDTVEPTTAPQKLRSSASPLPQVQTFIAGTTTTAEVVAALREAGGCIVRGLVQKESLGQIERDLRPHLDADQPWNGIMPLTLEPTIILGYH
jgi:hypothetical protein